MERENARGLLHSRSPDGREFAPGVLATWCEALRARGGAARGAAVAVVCRTPEKIFQTVLCGCRAIAKRET